MNNLITTFVFIILIGFGYSQELEKSDLTNKYWGISRYQLINLQITDTVIIDNLPRKEDVFELPYGNGFVLNIDGSFEEILNRTCGYDRIPYKGNWTLNEKTLKLTVGNNIWLKMKIIELNTSEIITTDWEN